MTAQVVVAFGDADSRHVMVSSAEDLPQGWISVALSAGVSRPASIHERAAASMLDVMTTLGPELAEAATSDDPDKREAITAKLTQAMSAMSRRGHHDEAPAARFQICPDCLRKPLVVPLPGVGIVRVEVTPG